MTEPFILTYDEFGKELITKSNEIFKETLVEMPLQNGIKKVGCDPVLLKLSGYENLDVVHAYIFHRLALTTTIYKNKQLRSSNLWPVTPMQFETLIEQGDIIPPRDYGEHLALVLGDMGLGRNQAEGLALFQSIKKNNDSLDLSDSNLESRLLVVNAGLEKDFSERFRFGVRPVVLPGLTEVYAHPTLNYPKFGRDKEENRFDHGLEHGLPSLDVLNKKGIRLIYLLLDNHNMGLRALFSNQYLHLFTWVSDLVYLRTPSAYGTPLDTWGKGNDTMLRMTFIQDKK